MFAHGDVEAWGRLQCHLALVTMCPCEMQPTDTVQFQLQQSFKDGHCTHFPSVPPPQALGDLHLEVSYDCCTRLPQTRQLETAQVY